MDEDLKSVVGIMIFFGTPALMVWLVTESIPKTLVISAVFYLLVAFVAWGLKR